MIRRLLVANRGEIAIRIQRSAAELGIACIMVSSDDDRQSLHVARAEHVALLPGQGAAAYLDAAAIVEAARDRECDAIHPGYGFLSENEGFARQCAEAGIVFVGPRPDQLALLGDKAAARALAERCGVPVPAGLDAGASRTEAREFMTALDHPVMIKAVSGGGGRGMRRVETLDAFDDAYDRCRSEAERAFGDPRLYVEQAIAAARHIEVQIVGDGRDVVHLGTRDCSLQRRNQKLIEIAPAPDLSEAQSGRLQDAALALARAVALENAATFEFLVETDAADPRVFFLEANPRLQVEHTVTEEIWGVDLVCAQLMIAGSASIRDLGLDRAAARPGYAVQARVGMERMTAEGTPVTAGGTLGRYELASGPGIRIDGFGYCGYATSTAFDSLLAKVIVSTRAPYLAAAIAKLDRALDECAIEGVETNISFLRAILARPEIAAVTFTTRFVDDHLPEIVEASDQADPDTRVAADGLVPLLSPLTGVVVDLLVAPGVAVAAGQPMAVVEAMKMEHVLAAPVAGDVMSVQVDRSSAVQAGQSIATIAPGDIGETHAAAIEAVDPDHIRDDLAEMRERQAAPLDAARGDTVAKRHAKGQRSARENIAALVDAGSFVEFGSLAVAAQRARRSMPELIARTPADGCIVGFGTINGDRFAAQSSQALVIAFDETVLAGTTGEMAREKMKHALATADQARRPVILLAEGGGGRAGDTDGKIGITGWTMDVSTYHQLSRMSGLVPLVGITSGRCFAANAGMLACCDVIIATQGANIGVGGPAMIEGGRLGRFAPEEIGPMDVQTANGVVDILVADETEATEVAKRYLSYFQGPAADWSCPDQRGSRTLVPENRLRVYDMRRVIETLADTGTMLELRAGFGRDILTALVRVEGRPLGVIANNPAHQGGAIESDGADKASRFMKLCEAFGLPILMLCDTPGMMVGPEAEKTATVRKMGRMFVTGANLTVPVMTIVTRKAYGIGAELMAGGWFKAPRFVVSWPTGEFGGMNIEGNVKLAHAAELGAIADPQARRARFEELVAAMHETGRALSVATHFEIDNVIDPADSRKWIMAGIMSHTPRLPGSDKAIPFVDPW